MGNPVYIELVEELEPIFGKFEKFVSGSGGRFKKESITILAVYHRGNDVGNLAELAINESFLLYLGGQVFLNYLHTDVAKYAKPKTKYKYPRVGFERLDQVNAFISAIDKKQPSVRDFLSNS
ncbi:hypothetical protein [Alcaligenes phenolicus]|uniref:hypothetical protein n=1 Tax=Alcaligenes TaxID=507 RepID=UPI0009F69A24|nr:hypothetical protein [Alcaligenes phenolicus]OQV33602.1 hypothetical protein BV899_05970 [Alcaligenes phenolicus]